MEGWKKGGRWMERRKKIEWKKMDRKKKEMDRKKKGEERRMKMKRKKKREDRRKAVIWYVYIEKYMNI